MTTSPRVIATTGGLYDQATGKWIGAVDLRGQEQIVLTPTERATLTAPGLLSDVSYDNANRAVAWRIDGVLYTASYSVNEISVAGSDGTTTTILLDPAQRIAGVITA